MISNIKNILTESEKTSIKNLYGLTPSKRNYVFEGWITVDGRYMIFKDEVFDLQEEKNIGNVWSSIDIFKRLFTEINFKSNEYQEIRENILKLPILENDDTLYKIRDFLLEWNFFDDTWLGSNLKSSGKSIKDAIVSGWDGLKKLGVNISKGDWNEIINLLSKGVLWILRKLKDALYSTMGMIADAILVATGIGKSVQWIPWALVTALDVYQFVNNDWPKEEQNNPTWLKLLYIGFDVLGLVTTGVFAKTARSQAKTLAMIGNDKTKLLSFINKNPQFKNTLQTILKSIKKVPQLLSSAQKYLSSKFPKGSNFISNVLSNLSGVLKQLENTLINIIGQTATKGIVTGTKIGGLLYGVEKGMNKLNNNKISNIDIENLKTLDNVIKTKYGGKDPFDM